MEMTSDESPFCTTLTRLGIYALSHHLPNRVFLCSRVLNKNNIMNQIKNKPFSSAAICVDSLGLSTLQEMCFQNWYWNTPSWQFLQIIQYRWNPSQGESIILSLCLISHATQSLPGWNCHERWQLSLSRVWSPFLLYRIQSIRGDGSQWNKVI